MEIYLVRHTTPLIEKGICYGQLDLDVADTFDAEYAQIKSKLPTNISDFEVLSSPLLRCQKIAAKLNQSYTINKRLQEVNFGKWEGIPWNDINKTELDIWMNDFVNQAPPQGESYTHLSKRATTAFFEICNASPKNKIIIAHAGVIRSIIAKLIDKSLQDSFEIKIPYAHVIQIQLTNNQFNIKDGLIVEKYQN